MSKFNRKVSGFTLVEVLVALAIVGLALPALLFYMATAADTTTYLRDKTVAQWVASNQYAEAVLTYRLTGEILNGSAGDELEMANTNWYWQVDSSALEEPFENILRFEIRVFHAADRASNVAQATPLVNMQALIEQ